MKRMMVAPLLALALCGALLLGSSTSEATQAGGSVTIQNFAFTPQTITVSVGSTVTWTNNDSAPHTATSASGVTPAFDTGTINQGSSGSVTFNTAGTFAYFCTIHPSMTGTVVVTDAGGDDDDDDDNGTATATATATGTATASPVAPGTGTGQASSDSSLPFGLIAGVIAVAVGAAGVVALRNR